MLAISNNWSVREVVAKQYYVSAIIKKANSTAVVFSVYIPPSTSQSAPEKLMPFDKPYNSVLQALVEDV